MIKVIKLLFSKNRLSLLGLFLLAIIALTALFAPFLSPFDPFTQDLYRGLNPPDNLHLLGQDRLGRDILSRIIYGTRISLLVGITTVFFSAGLGIFIGSVAGYRGGFIDNIIMRICDIFLAFPGILLAIGIMSIMGPGITNVIIALSIMGWAGYARLARGQVLYLKEMNFIIAAKAMGAGSFRIIKLHIIPNLIGPVIIEATFGIASAILAEAGLSFLGIGVQVPQPSWGAMLNEGKRYLLIAPHMTMVPGFCIMLTIIAINFIGDALRDLFDMNS